MAHQRANEVGTLVFRVMEWIGLRTDLKLIVGQCCLEMFERDGAVEAKLQSRVVEGCDGNRIVEHVMQPAKISGLWHDVQFRFDETEIMTLSRAKHHAMFAQSNRFRVAVGGDVPHREKPHAGSSRAVHKACPVETDRAVPKERPTPPVSLNGSPLPSLLRVRLPDHLRSSPHHSAPRLSTP